MHGKFHPWVSLYSTNFYQSNLLSMQMNKDKSDVKKNLFPIQRFEKNSSRQPQNYSQFFSKIIISLFLKIALFICILQLLSCSDVLFYFTPQKFQCNSTDFQTLHHSQTYYVMKTTYDIKFSQILLFKIVEFTHLNLKFDLHVKFQLLLLCFMMENNYFTQKLFFCPQVPIKNYPIYLK